MNQNNIPRGRLSVVILSTLLSGDKYGYEIINEIKEKTNNEIIIKQPSLYSSLTRMEKQKIISSYWRESELGGKRHYYSLTDFGKKQLEQMQTSLYIDNSNINQNDKSKIDDKKNINDESKIKTNGETKIETEKSLLNQDLDNLSEDSPNQTKSRFNEDFSDDTNNSQNKESEEKNDNIVNLNKNSDDDILKENSDKLENVDTKLELNLNNNAIPETVNKEELKQDSFLNSPTIKIKTSQMSKSENETMLKSLQVDLFEQDKSVIEPSFNLEAELKRISTNNSSFEEGYNNYVPPKLNIIKNKINEQNDIINPPIFEEEIINNNDKTSNNSQLDLNSENNKKSKNINSDLDTDTEDLNENEFIDLSCLNSDLDKKLNSEEVILNSKNNSFANRLNNINNNSQSNQSLNKLNNTLKKDDGIFIKDKYSPEQIPKVKKIQNPVIFDNNEDSIFQKINPNNMETQYTEKINSLYNESKNLDEKTFVNPTDLSALSYKELDNYYKNINVKFSVHNQNNYSKANAKVNSPYNPFFFNKYFIIFMLIVFESLGCYFLFNYLGLSPNYSILYFLVPLPFIIKPIYYLACKDKPQIDSYIKHYPFIFDILIFIIGIVIIYSLNILIGMTTDNILSYTTTLLYPSILFTNIIVSGLFNIYFIKKVI